MALRAGSRSTIELAAAGAGPRVSRASNWWRAFVRALRFRVRALLAAVGLVAVLVWTAMMGFRSCVHHSLASRYSFQERGWREEAAEGRIRREDCLECADFCARMAGKHRRAMWRPWLPVASDPPVYLAGADREKQRREAAKSHAEP
jgi:hypothetical protein